MQKHGNDMKPEVISTEWLNKHERSNTLTIKLMVWLALTLGRRVARLFLPFICFYFLIFSKNERFASTQYLARVLGRKPNLRDNFSHFYSFAATILDRVYFLNDRVDMMNINVYGIECIEKITSEQRGCILLGAHLGSFEVLRACARVASAPSVNMVMYEENAQKLNSVLSAINPRLNQQVIGLGKPDSMLKVASALQRGEFVGILADRAIESEEGQRISFLGSPAIFPTGPLRMSMMLKCPVVQMVGLYRGKNNYDVYFEELVDMAAIDSSQRTQILEETLKKYVERIEQHCRTSPYNWFNFFDFWKGA